MTQWHNSKNPKSFFLIIGYAGVHFLIHFRISHVKNLHILILDQKNLLDLLTSNCLNFDRGWSQWSKWSNFHFGPVRKKIEIRIIFTWPQTKFLYKIRFWSTFNYSNWIRIEISYNLNVHQKRFRTILLTY